MKLLHYKYIEAIEHVQKKWDRTGVEISEINVKNSWGVERKNSVEIRKRYKYVKRKAERVIHNNKLSIQRIIDWVKRDRNP